MNSKIEEFKDYFCKFKCPTKKLEIYDEDKICRNCDYYSHCIDNCEAMNSFSDHGSICSQCQLDNFLRELEIEKLI